MYNGTPMVTHRVSVVPTIRGVRIKAKPIGKTLLRYN